MDTEQKSLEYMAGTVGPDPMKGQAQPPRLRLRGQALVPDTSCDAETWSQELCSALGVQNLDWAVQLLDLALNAVPSEGADKAQLANTLIAAIADLRPRDSIEAILAVQVVVTNFTAFSLLNQANTTNLPGLAETRFNLAEKLLKLNIQQLRTLDSHRRQGQQHFRVEHIHINSGAQAIVGTVHGGG